MIDRTTPGPVFAAAAFCLGQIVAWAAFVTMRVPFFAGTPEPVEAIAVVCKGIEPTGSRRTLRGRSNGDFAGVE